MYLYYKFENFNKYGRGKYLNNTGSCKENYK